MSDFLTLDQILATNDCRFEDVDMADLGWPGKVRIAVFSAASRNELESRLMQSEGKITDANFRERVIALAMVDPQTGKRLIETDEQLEALSQKSAESIDRLYQVASRLNKIMTEKGVDEEIKNSSPTQEDFTLSD
jgi:hypothetical protein